MKATQPPGAGEPADATPLGVLHDLVGYHLRRAANVVAADFVRVLGDTGIRQVLFAILSVVSRNPGINQGAIGRCLGIQRANMVSLINELVDAGLIERQVSAEDRRAFSVFLTDKGRSTFARCIEVIAAHEDDLLSDFSPTERRRLIALLLRIEARET